MCFAGIRPLPLPLVFVAALACACGTSSSLPSDSSDTGTPGDSAETCEVEDTTTCPEFSDEATFPVLEGVRRLEVSDFSPRERVEVFESWDALSVRLAEFGAEVERPADVDWVTTQVVLAWSLEAYTCLYGEYLQGVHAGGMVEYVDYRSCCAGDTADVANLLLGFLLVVPVEPLTICSRRWLCDGPSGCAEGPPFESHWIK